MNPAELALWQKRCGIRSQTEAAHILRIHRVSYARKLKGRTPITERDRRLCECHELETRLDPVMLAGWCATLQSVIRTLRHYR